MGGRNRKWIRVVLVLCMLFALSIAAYAYLSSTSNSVENSFTADKNPTPTIQETFNGYVKENVSVSVGSTAYAVYVRAAIVVTWKNDAGDVLAQSPVAGDDYFIDLNTGDGKPWFLQAKDGFYYYSSMIREGATKPLIKQCRQMKAAPVDGYALHVEIIAQTIQAVGYTDDKNIPAVQAAWGVLVDQNGKLLPGGN